MKYTVIHLETFEMKVVEAISPEEVAGLREGHTAIVDMATGHELAPDEVMSARGD
jgi:hypothetical protein